MKTIVFYGVAAYGHMNPTLNVARELKKRGYNVLYYSMPDFKIAIEDAGVTFKDYEYKLSFDLTISRNVGLMSRKSVELTREILPKLLKQAKEIKPDLVIHDSMSIWGKIISHQLHVPGVSVSCILTYNKKLLKKYPKLTLIGAKDGGYHVLRAFLAYRKLLKDYDMKKEAITDVVVNKENLNIIFTTSYFHPVSNGFDNTFKFVGASIYPRNEKNNFMDKIEKGKKIIYLSLGTVINDNIEFYRLCANAFSDSPYQVVLSLGKRFTNADIGPLPKNVIAHQYINQLDMLQHTDVFVSHGGMNGINESMYYGVPMVLIPDTQEQTALSQQVAELGAGICLYKHRITREILLSAVEKILNNKSYYEKAALVKNSLHKKGGYKEAADEIEKYIAKAAFHVNIKA